jgi:hypothetical protein
VPLPDGPPAPLAEPSRLVELAGALSPTTATAANGDLHHRDLGVATALRLTFGDVSSVQALSPKEVRDRVRVRFPALAPLPQRPRLDELVREAGLQLQFDDRAQGYRPLTRTGDTTGLASRQPTTHATPLSGAGTSEVTRRVEESLRTRAFLALGVPADRLDKFQRGATRGPRRAGRRPHERPARGAARPGGAARGAVGGGAGRRRGIRDEPRTDWVSASSSTARGRRFAPWSTRPWMPDAGPVVLTEASPLARYDNLGLLSRWTDLGSLPVASGVAGPSPARSEPRPGDRRPPGSADRPASTSPIDNDWIDNANRPHYCSTRRTDLRGRFDGSDRRR